MYLRVRFCLNVAYYAGSAFCSLFLGANGCYVTAFIIAFALGNLFQIQVQKGLQEQQ